MGSQGVLESPPSSTVCHKSFLPLASAESLAFLQTPHIRVSGETLVSDTALLSAGSRLWAHAGALKVCPRVSFGPLRAL